jgi:hypothetical protein
MQHSKRSLFISIESTQRSPAIGMLGHEMEAA